MVVKAPEPFQQGEFDGLCAVYSTINAIRLALAPKKQLTYQQCQTLFFEAIQLMESKNKLGDTLASGTNFIFWFALQRQLCRVTTELTGAIIKIERPFKSSKGVSLNQLRKQVLYYQNQGQISLAALAGYYKHYTVIQRATASRIFLFDSYGYHWVNWNNVRTSSKAGNQLHIFRPSSLSAMRLID